MAALNTQPNIARPDDVYQLLIDLHEGRSESESQRLNARLLLLLANHIGDLGVLREAVELARSDPSSPQRTEGQ